VPGVAATQVGEGDEPVGTGHQQHQYDTKVDGRLVRQQAHQCPNEQGHDQEIANHRCEQEAMVAQGIAYVIQGTCVNVT